MAELRMRLRQATAPLHDRVDSAFSGFDLQDPDDYRRFLRAHYRVLCAAERALEQAAIGDVLDDWPARVRRHALGKDLAQLGCALPSPAPLAKPNDDAACWGIAYVLEGSRLGGRVLARRLREANPQAPTRYLEHGDVAVLWPGFLARLERDAARCAWEPMLAAAETTFALFAEAATQERACEPG